MSGLHGKITRKDKLDGGLTPKPEISGSIYRKNGITGRVCPYSGFSGVLRKAGEIYNVIAKPLFVFYRFLSANGIIRSRHTAEANIAPAVEIEADSAIKASKAAPLAAHPAKGISVDQKERVSVYAKLVAYRRAACVYIKQLFFKRTAELIAAPGAVAKYSKAVKLNRTSKAIAADSAIMESRFNTIAHSYEAAGSSAPAQIVPAVESNFRATHTAKPATAKVVGVNINNALRVNHSAKMATWIDPVVVDGVLILRQAYSATQEENVLVVD